ncbi:ABC transporter family protein [Wolffia australiana]
MSALNHSSLYALASHRHDRASAVLFFFGHSSSFDSRRALYPPPLRPMLRFRRKSSVFRSPRASVSPEFGGEEKDKQEEARETPEIGTLFRRFWEVAAPYWSSEDKNEARLRLAAVFALTLATTGISVGFNFLGRDFYNALANKDQAQFTKQLLYYLGAFAGGIPVFVLRDYFKDTLSLRWRSWMTSYYMKRYFQNQTFYKIQSQSIIDNPDQRIVDDLSSFTSTALGFSLIFFNATVDLISFSNILYGIYPPLFIVLLVYSIGGTGISIYLGKNLVSLNFMQEKKEADFRYGLARIRENSESIAFYGGEENELQLLLRRFSRAFENLSKLLISSRNLDFFTSGYRYLIQVLPVAVVAPMYFSGKIEFGVINQSVSAFNHILNDVSLIVYQFQAISAFSAIIDRLGEFDDVLEGKDSSDVLGSENGSELDFQMRSIDDPSLDQSNSTPRKLLEIKDLMLQTPRTGRTLISDLNLEIKDRDHLLVMGPSGSGKTSLLRALAGLWRSGSGGITFFSRVNGQPSSEVARILRYKRAEGVFFLPQRPYMVLGTLRDQLLYPTWTDDLPSDPPSSSSSSDILPSSLKMENLRDRRGSKPSDEDLLRVLADVRLGDIVSRFKGLDSTYDWASVLSLGEQQRLAFARLLLAEPSLVLLDESTSALDEPNEAHLYRLIEDAGITYVSIGHRRTLFNFHNQVLRIAKLESTGTDHRNWVLEPIKQS